VRRRSVTGGGRSGRIGRPVTAAGILIARQGPLAVHRVEPPPAIRFPSRVRQPRSDCVRTARGKGDRSPGLQGVQGAHCHASNDPVFRQARRLDLVNADASSRKSRCMCRCEHVRMHRLGCPEKMRSVRNLAPEAHGVIHRFTQ
jgi:hypothetical protein